MIRNGRVNVYRSTYHTYASYLMKRCVYVCVRSIQSCHFDLGCGDAWEIEAFLKMEGDAQLLGL